MKRWFQFTTKALKELKLWNPDLFHRSLNRRNTGRNRSVEKRLARALHIANLLSEPQLSIGRMTNWQRTMWSRAIAPARRKSGVAPDPKRFLALRRPS